MEEISIIVPVYNVQDYLETCINSILKQTYRNIEIILINDGSTDNSGRICEKYANIDTRIQVINKENGGLSDARNKGIENARGRYLLFVDSDDYIHPQACEILLHNMQEQEADISIGSFIKIEQYREPEHVDNSIQVFSGRNSCFNIYGELVAESIIACGKLYKRELFESIRYPVGKLHEDEFTTYKLLYKAKKVVYSSAKLYYYLQRCSSIMNSEYDERHLVLLDMSTEMINFYEKNQDVELAQLAIKRMFDLCKMQIEIYNSNKNVLCRRYLQKQYFKLWKEYGKSIKITCWQEVIAWLYSVNLSSAQILERIVKKARRMRKKVQI